MYSINYNLFSDIYALPKKVCKLMEQCSELQIKSYLLLLQSDGNVTALQISDRLGCSVVKAEESLQFWVQNGCVNQAAAPAPVEAVQQEEPKGKAAVKNDLTVSREEATTILGYDEGARYLMYEAENIKGEPISPSEAAGYISIYKLQGMPVEVLLLLIKYSQSVGKYNLKYIRKTAAEWLNAGIDTLEKADAHLNALERQKQLAGQFMAACGINDRSLTKMENEYLYKWSQNMGFDMDMIVYAYEVGIEYTGRLNCKYMNSVLTAWHAKGIKTVQEAKLQSAPEKAPKPTRRTTSTKGRTGMENTSFTAPDTTSRFGRRVLKTEKE